MNLATNAVGIEHGESGKLTFTSSTFTNTKDIEIPGTGSVEFVDGTIDVSTVDVTGTGLFTRMRALDVTVQADGNPVDGTSVALKDANGVILSSSDTDASGATTGLRFTTATVDSSGLQAANLNGFELVTIAKIGAYYYTSSADNAGEFRYAMDTPTVTDNPGNTHTMDLVDKVDIRVCRSSTSYNVVSTCPGISSTSSSGRTYNSNLIEYGHSGALPYDMSNKVIMFDAGINQLKTSAVYNFNGSTILVTGATTSSTSPVGIIETTSNLAEAQESCMPTTLNG